MIFKQFYGDRFGDRVTIYNAHVRRHGSCSTTFAVTGSGHNSNLLRWPGGHNYNLNQSRSGLAHYVLRWPGGLQTQSVLADCFHGICGSVSALAYWYLFSFHRNHAGHVYDLNRGHAFDSWIPLLGNVNLCSRSDEYYGAISLLCTLVVVPNGY